MYDSWFNPLWLLFLFLVRVLYFCLLAVFIIFFSSSSSSLIFLCWCCSVFSSSSSFFLVFFFFLSFILGFYSHLSSIPLLFCSCLPPFDFIPNFLVSSFRQLFLNYSFFFFFQHFPPLLPLSLFTLLIINLSTPCVYHYRLFSLVTHLPFLSFTSLSLRLSFLLFFFFSL